MLFITSLLSWIFGIVLSGYLTSNILVFIFGLFFLAVHLICHRLLAARPMRKIRGFIPECKLMLCLFFCLLGMLHYSIWETTGYLDAISYQKEAPDRLSGTVVSSVSRYDTTDYFYLKEDSGRKIRVKIRTEKPLQTGQHVTLYEPTLSPVNIYNPTGNHLGNGSFLTATFPYQPKITVDGIGDPLRYYAKLARDKVGEIFNTHFPKEIAGFLTALVSSDQSGIADGLYQDFVSTGSIHILVVSGIHFQYLAGALIVLLGAFFQSRRVKLLVSLPLLLAFCIFTGGTLPVLRAFFMTLLLFAGDLFYMKRLNPSLTVTALAGVFLLICPYLIRNPSFLLTFGATVGIIWFYESVSAFFHFIPWKFLRSYLSLQLSVQVFTMPVVCFFFSRVSKISILTNFLLSPLIPIVLILAMVIPFVIKIPLLSQVFLIGTRWISELFLWCVKATSSLAKPWKIAFHELTFLLFLCLGVSLFYIKISRKRYERVLSLLLCTVFLVIGFGTLLMPVPNPYVTLTFFGASNTNSAAITTPNNHLILYGTMKDILSGRYTGAYHQETPVDLLILTKLTQREMLDEFLKTNPVKQVILPAAYQENFQASCPVLFCKQSVTTELDGINLSIIADKTAILEVEFS